VASKEKRELPVVNADGVGRRELLQGLFAGVGASVALPVVAEQTHPTHTAPAVAAAQAKAKAADWKPEFLNAHQFATVSLLCARIVPGSEKGQTDRFLDALLAVDIRDRQARFMNALGAIEGAALARFQKSFKSLSEAQQIELLTAASTSEPGRKEWIWKPGEVLKEPERGPEVLTLRDHFDVMKGAIVDAYYSSEAGLKELGYTGRMFFAEFPDCKHEEHT
jgi:hypothetical protein